MRSIPLLLLLAGCAGSGTPSVAGYRGPAGISADRRHFVDGDGRPCFWLGDTEWELFTAFTPEEAGTLLEDRAKKGFTVIQVMILGVKGTKSPGRPLLNDDPATPNESYFAGVDDIVRRAELLGLTLVIGVWHKSPDYSKAITPANARGWAAWLGRRYKAAPNLFWSMFPVATDASVPIVRELAAGLAEGDGGRHLITVHPDPSPASSSWIHGEPWLAFNTLQTWKSDELNYTMVAADHAKTPVKPAVNGEARYEEEGGTTPVMVRRGAWWSVLAGGFYTYGHGGNWMKPGDWRRWMDSPASGQMKILRDVFEGLDWWTLVPDPGLLLGSAPGVVAARAADRRWAVVYLPNADSVKGRSVAVDLNALAPGLNPVWLNPATGETVSALRQTARGPFPVHNPDGWVDAVLLFRAP